MATNLMRQGDTDVSGLVQYCCDTRADISSLPDNDNPGSSAIVIEDSSVWMLGSDNIWHEL